MRKCKICLKDKPFEDFYSNGKTPKGTPKFHTSCKLCEGSRIKSRRSEVINLAFKNASCILCGYDRCSNAIEFHHVYPETKKHNPGDMLKKNFNESRILDELKKCVPLCANCHRELHAGLHTIHMGEVTVSCGTGVDGCI